MSNERLLYLMSLCQSNLFSCLTLSSNCAVILKSFFLIILSFLLLSQVSDQHSSLKAFPAYFCSSFPLSFIGIFPNKSLSLLTLLVSTPGESNQHSFKEGWFPEEKADVISLSSSLHAHQLSLASFSLCQKLRTDSTRWTWSFCILLFWV